LLISTNISTKNNGQEQDVQQQQQPQQLQSTIATVSTIDPPQAIHQQQTDVPHRNNIAQEQHIKDAAPTPQKRQHQCVTSTKIRCSNDKDAAVVLFVVLV